MLTNIAEAYQFLKHAELGYLQELSNGHLMYEKTYAQVKQLLADAQFDPVRAKYDQLFAEEY